MANGQGASPEPVFCADAIADPLTGACGALAVALSRSAGGGELIDLPMRDVAAAFSAAPDHGPPHHGPHDIRPSGSVACPRWHREQAVLPPRRPPPPAGPARHAAGTRRRHRRGAGVARRTGRHVLIRNARVWPPDAHLAAEAALAEIPRGDVRLAGGLIAECGPSLRPERGEEVMEAAGGVLLPGLHDHHVHLRALAAAAASVSVGPPLTRTGAELAARLRAADADLPAGAWLRAVGYHESVAGPLDRHVLDRILPRRPLRVQHRTGALWVVNSPAAARLGLDGCELSGVERDGAGRPTGRLWRMDRWLADRVPRAAADLGAVSRKAGSLGITGFTDATPGATDADLAFLAGAPVAQRVCCMAPPGVFPPPETISLGPVKVMLDDTTLPALAELADLIRGAHAAGRPAVAVHCVTRVQLVLTLAALDVAGRLPGDRIEHGAVIPAESLLDLRGLTVVTQPHFVAERGEQYARDVPPDDLPDLWRLRSLIDVGVRVAGGTDAPFGSEDPWHVMRAAVRRPGCFRPDEAVSPGPGIALFLGEPGTPHQASSGWWSAGARPTSCCCGPGPLRRCTHSGPTWWPRRLSVVSLPTPAASGRGAAAKMAAAAIRLASCVAVPHYRGWLLPAHSNSPS